MSGLKIDLPFAGQDQRTAPKVTINNKVTASDFAGARERLAAAGVESAPPIDWGDHDCIYFLDPDGNLLEMVSYR